MEVHLARHKDYSTIISFYVIFVTNSDEMKEAHDEDEDEDEDVTVATGRDAIFSCRPFPIFRIF